MVKQKTKLVGVTTNYWLDKTTIPEGVPTFYERVRYNEVILKYTGAIPVMVPSLGKDMLPVLERLDGMLFTGSPSNVHPNRYGGVAPRSDNIADEVRDETTLNLLQAALKMGLPMLCICRGAQELNVAMGGSLHQHVEELPGKLDHRYVYGDDYDYGFRAVHNIEVVKGGMLEKIYQGKLDWQVNSAHGQGIDQLAKGLKVEAVAPDGIIEAYSYPDYKGWLLALQWHPEHRSVLKDWHNQVLFEEFGKQL